MRREPFTFKSGEYTVAKTRMRIQQGLPMVRVGKPDLAKLHAKGDLEGLIKALAHRNAEVRRKAAERLGWIGDARAESALLHHLDDADASVQAAAASALRQIRDRQTLEQRRTREEALLASGDPDALARYLVEEKSREAMRALLQCDESAATEALQRLGPIRTARLLVEIMPPTVRVLEPDERGYQAVAFGGFDDVVDLENRCAAVRLLDLIWSDEVASGFRDDLESRAKYYAQQTGSFVQRKDKLGEARLLAAKLGERAERLLKSIKDHWAESTERWEDSSSDFMTTMRPAAELMTRTIELIERGTHDYELVMLDHLLQKLVVAQRVPSGSGLPDGILQVLTEGGFLATRSSSNRTSRSAGQIFDKVYDLIRPKSMRSLLEIFDEVEPAPRTGFLRALERDLGDEVVEPAIAGLGDPDPAIRAAAADVLGQLGYHRAVDPLISATKDTDPRVRTLTAVALGLLGERLAVPALTQLVDDPDPSVTQASREALDRLKTDL